MSDTFVFVLNLPRTYGQSFREALTMLYFDRVQGGASVWHSLGQWWRFLKPGDIGATEVWAPVSYLVDEYPDARFLVPIREDEDAWVESCVRMLAVAYARRFNHPLWGLHPSQFRFYRREYLDLTLTVLENAKANYVVEVVPEGPGPGWEPICALLNLDRPHIDFPRIDIYGQQTSEFRSLARPAGLSFGPTFVPQ